MLGTQLKLAVCKDVAGENEKLMAVNDTPTAPPSFPVFRFGQERPVTVELPNKRGTRNVVMTVPPRTPKGRRPPLIEPKSISYRKPSR